jgi:peptidyl-prolyl cis-trans isomerase B (cyclophilin B)
VTYPPPYGQYPPPPYPGYTQPRRTNAMAIASLVTSFIFAPLGIVFGHISLSQIKKSGEEGKGLAVAGLAIGYVLTVTTAVVVAIVVWFTTAMAHWADSWTANYPSNPGIPSNPLPDSNLPQFKPPATLGSNCQYPKTTEKASKPVTPPRTGKVPTTPPIVGATMVTNLGPIGLQLDNAKSPCTVNNFASLAQQGYFDATTCHRLTTSSSLGVLQCGDPTGTGAGGPGYRFPNEYPTNQYRLADPALQEPVLYPRGTLAMANAGSGTNGSQFFLVYADSRLPPTYTVFGSIDTTGLDLLDKVAAGGVENGTDDGKPKTTVTIQQVRLD